MGSKKEKVVILVVLVAAALAAVGAGTTSYLVGRKTSALKAANAALDTRIAAAKTKINKLPTMRVEREHAQARLVVAESILPSQKEIETLVDSLSEFAKSSGIVIAKAEPVRQMTYRAQKAGVQRFEQADFNLDVVGDYFQLVDFVNRLENYKRFIKVDSFTASKGSGEEDPLSVKLKFSTYTYVDTAATAKPVTAVKGVVK